MRPLYFLLILSIPITSCEGGWTDEDKQQFAAACEAGRETPVQNRKAYCDCRLQQTMKVYPTINAMVENVDSTNLRLALENCRPGQQ